MTEGKSKKVLFVPRVTQLDAIEFDEEIRNLLTSQVLEISKFLKPGALNNVRLEIKLFINLLVFKYSILRNSATFGQQLLNIKYDNQLSTKLSNLYIFLHYGVPYVKEKYEEFLIGYCNERMKNILDTADALIKISNILNLLLFLREGMYPTLTDRLLQLKYVPINKLSRNVGYSYMTRELLWHGFMELLMFTLPLINYQALKRQLSNLIFMKSNDRRKEQLTVACSLDTKCAVCQDVPTMPCRISQFCPHLACYYCVMGNILADEKFNCPLCSEVNTAHEHLQFVRC